MDNMIADGTVDPNVSGRPYTYGDPANLKVLVVMTDGQNTGSLRMHEDFRTGPSNIWFKDDSAIGSYKFWVRNAANSGPSYRYLEYDASGAPIPHAEPQWVASPAPGSINLDWPQVLDRFTMSFIDRKLENLASVVWNGHPAQRPYQSWTKGGQMEDICNATKAQGITVYSIGYEISMPGTALERCATDPAHAYEANGANISDIFTEIAAQIKGLRLTN